MTGNGRISWSFEEKARPSSSNVMRAQSTKSAAMAGNRKSMDNALHIKTVRRMVYFPVIPEMTSVTSIVQREASSLAASGMMAFAVPFGALSVRR